MPGPAVVPEQPKQAQPGGVVIPPDPPPDRFTSNPEQVKKVKEWLAERKYQIKKVGDEYHISRKDTRSGSVYDINYQIPASMPDGSYTLTVLDVTFEVINKVLYITINGVGRAGFEVDGYGNLKAVDPSANR